MIFISAILRIIEAGQEGNQDKLKGYSLKLSRYLRELGHDRYAKCIEEKFNPESNIIIQDERKNS